MPELPADDLHGKYTESSAVFKASVGGIKKLICAVKTEHAQAQNQVELLLGKLEEKNKQLLELTKKLEAESSEKLTMHDDFLQCNAKLSKSEEQKILLRTDLLQLEGKLTDLSELCSEQKQQLVSYEHETKTLERELQHCLCDKKSLESKVDELLVQLARNEDDTNRKLAEIQSEKLECQNKLLDISVNEESLSNETSELKQRLKEYEHKMMASQEESTTMSAKCCKLRVQKKKFQAVAERLQERVTSMEKKIQEAGKRENELSLAVKNCEKKCSALTAAEGKLKTRTIELRDEIDKNMQLIRENEFLKEKLSKMSDEKKRMYSTIDKLGCENQSLRSSVRVAGNDKANISNEHERQVIELKAVARQLEEDLTTARSEARNQRKALTDLQQDYMNVQFSLKEAERRESEQKAIAVQMTEREESLLEQNRQLESDLISSNEKLKLCSCMTKNNAEQLTTESSLLKMLTDLKLKRIEAESAAQQTETVKEQAERIAELEGKLRQKDVVHHLKAQF